MFNSDTPTTAKLPGTGKLIRSTILALIGAAVLLITIVLPAEYGIDPTGIGNKLGLTNIYKASSGQTASDHLTSNNGNSMAITPVSTADWRDEVSVTIDGYGQLELKLVMQAGESATFEWEADGGKFNTDLHGDGSGEKFISYHLTKGTTEDSGTFTAEFDGTHGWYWVNISRHAATMTLRTNGDYAELKRVL